MIKTIRRIIMFCFFIIVFVLINVSSTSALEKDKVKVYFIFDHLAYAKGDYINIDINISDFEKISEIKMGINNSDDFSFEKTFQINSGSGFTKELVSNITEDKGLRAHLEKEGETLQSNLGSLTLVAKNELSDVTSLVSEDVTFYMFDEENHLIEHEIIFKEKLNATWNILLDELEVYQEVPDYLSSFFVSNRKSDEYEIILKQTIDATKIGTQVLSIIVIDKLTCDYLLFNKPIDVVDKTSPCLDYVDKIIVNDDDIDNLDLSLFIKVNDNYDEDAKVEYTYYNKDKEQISSFALFKDYLSHNYLGYVEFYGVDSSLNKTENILVEVNVTDCTSPIVSSIYNKEIVIEDININEFNLESCFSVKDEYDKEPSLVIEVFDKDNNLVDNYKEELFKKGMLEVRCYGVDESTNKSSVLTIKLIIKDTTAPIIEGVSDIIINDVDLSSDFYLSQIKYYDNIDTSPTLNISFYINEELTNQYLFLEKLKKGYKGCIAYQVVDSSNNKSEIYYQMISVIDTIPPEIVVTNIKENGKYLKVEEITYEVKDNFEEVVEAYIEVNGSKYTNSLINEVGEYVVLIYAKDKAGNEVKKEFKFNIIENNIKGCDGDVKCYVDNYLDVIIVVSVLTIASICLVVVKIIIEKKKEKTKVKEIKEEKI